MIHRLIRYLCIYSARMSPALNGNSALQHFKRGNAVEIHNGIMFDFYLGLSHLQADLAAACRRDTNLGTGGRQQPAWQTRCQSP